MEDYVTFEQANALRELGFDWKTYCAYDKSYKDDRPWELRNYHTPQNHNIAQYSASAPTLAQAQRWLREVKGIAVCVQSFDSNKDPRYGNFWWKEYYLPNCEERGPQWAEWWVSGHHPIFPNYEEALTDGISKMLELIINKKIN